MRGIAYLLAEIYQGKNFFLKFDYNETWEAHLWGFEWYRIYLFHKEYNLSMGNTNFPEWPFDTGVLNPVPGVFIQNDISTSVKLIKYVGDEFYHDLRFISLMDSRLSRKYSIEKKKKTISEQTWEYWNNILKQSEYTGDFL